MNPREQRTGTTSSARNLIPCFPCRARRCPQSRKPMPVENTIFEKHYRIGKLARMMWRRVWLRLAGEWLAVKWCLSAVWLAVWSAVCAPFELISTWKEIHPFIKCPNCLEWGQNQEFDPEAWCYQCRMRKRMAEIPDGRDLDDDVFL